MYERVKLSGIGLRYVRLLGEAGIDRVEELGAYEHRADELLERLAETKNRTRIVQRLPSQRAVAQWTVEATILTVTGAATGYSRLAGRVRIRPSARRRVVAGRDGMRGLPGRPKTAPTLRAKKEKPRPPRRPPPGPPRPLTEGDKKKDRDRLPGPPTTPPGPQPPNKTKK